MMAKRYTGLIPHRAHSWKACAIGGLLSAALLFGGTGWTLADDDKPKPEEKSDQKQKPEEKSDQNPSSKRNRERDRADRPSREGRNPNALLGVDDLKKQIEAAAKKGDIDTVRKLLDRMERQLTQRGPRDMGRFPPFGPFGGPQADRMRQMMERSMRSFEEALDQLKDNPEARAQIEKAMEELRRRGAGGRFGAGELPGFGFGGQRPGSPRFGVGVAPVSEELAEQLNVPEGKGVVVKEVFPSTPAAKAGLKENDVILAFNGQSVNGDVRTFAQEVAKAKSGQPLTITILRKGKKQTLKGIELPDRRAADRGSSGERVTFEEMAVRLTNGQFEINAKKGGTRYKLIGQAEETGAPELSKITITEGGESNDYKSLSAVPAEYRAAVKQLLASIGAGGRSR
jgi:hypothetical protein